MDCLYLLNILFSLTVLQGTKYSISQEGVSGCTLASPPIYYTENGAYLNFSKIDIEEMSDAVKENANFRKDYVQHYVVFVYSGCALSSVIQSTKYNHFENSAGQCYTRCGTDFVGLQGNTCHCISNVPRNTLFTQRGCSECSIEKGSLCGGQNVVSLYRTDRSKNFLNQSLAQDNNKNCLALTYSNNGLKFFWTECSQWFKVVCIRDHMTYNTLKYGSWGNAMQMCFENSFRPLNDMAPTQNLPNDSSQIWTEYIRSLSRIPQTAPVTHVPRVSYAQLTSQIYTSRTKHFVKTEITTQSTTATGEKPVSRQSVLPLTVVSEAANHPSTSNGAEHVSTYSLFHPVVSEANLVHNIQDGGESAVKLVLYTVIPASLVIILGVVSYILWRRGSIPICRRTGGDLEENMSTTTANTKLESDPYSDGQIHDYFTLESQDNYETVKNINEYERTEGNHDRASIFTHDYDLSVTGKSTEVFEEDDYDTIITTFSKPSRDASAMSSIYNRLDNGDPYNHIGEMSV